MKFIKFFLIILIGVLPILCVAQKIKDGEGQVPSLRGQKEIHVEFDYSNMTVGKYDEKEYVAKTVKRKNKRKAKTGDWWKKEWFENRRKFENEFLNLFNKQTRDHGLTATKSDDKAKYTMLVQTIHTEIGFDAYVVRKGAYINLDILFYEIGSEKIIGELFLDRIKEDFWGSHEYSSFGKLEGCYSTAGRKLGRHFKKQFK